MAETRVCQHCNSVLTPGQICGCPGAQREKKRMDAIRERAADEIHIRLDKIPGDENFYPDIYWSSSTALIYALARLMLLVAERLQAPVENVYAKVATVLFADPGKTGES